MLDIVQNLRYLSLSIYLQFVLSPLLVYEKILRSPLKPMVSILRPSSKIAGCRYFQLLRVFAIYVILQIRAYFIPTFSIALL